MPDLLTPEELDEIEQSQLSEAISLMLDGDADEASS
jgi:hypothetical protein